MSKSMEDMGNESARITTYEILLSLLKDDEISMEAALKRVSDIDAFNDYLQEHGYMP